MLLRTPLQELNVGCPDWSLQHETSSCSCLRFTEYSSKWTVCVIRGKLPVSIQVVIKQTRMRRLFWRRQRDLLAMHFRGMIAARGSSFADKQWTVQFICFIKFSIISVSAWWINSQKVLLLLASLIICYFIVAKVKYKLQLIKIRIKRITIFTISEDLSLIKIFRGIGGAGMMALNMTKWNSVFKHKRTTLPTGWPKKKEEGSRGT